MSTFDVVVVGGGPAGSSAAGMLAAHGLRVAVVDKAGRPKPCGGFLPEKALRRMPVAAVQGLPCIPIQAIQLRSPVAGSIQVNSHRALGYMVKREQLDRLLLQAAEDSGAAVLRDCTALGCERQARGWRVCTSQGPLTADYLIGADGVHGRMAVGAGVRRRLPRWQLAFSRVAELRWRDNDRLPPPNRLQLCCLPVLGGLGWVFPLDGGANVGVAGSSLDLQRIHRAFAQVLKQVETEVGPFDVVWQQGWWLPAGGISRPVTGERALLVGDAAGFVDCFCGEGIYYAITSGQLAAHAIAASYSDWRQVGRHYRRDCQTLLLPTLRRSLLLSGIIGRRKQRYYQALQAQPELATHLLSLMHSERPYHGMLAPLLWAVHRPRFSIDRQQADLQLWGAEQVRP